MPTFEKTIFTNLGIGFVNDLNSAHSKLVSATSVYSSTDLSGMSDDDIKNMTDIANKELTANCDIIKIDNKQTKIRSTANNESLKQGVYIRSYATYVVDQDGNQTLFAIKVNTKPQFLPAFDGVNANAQSYGFNVGISQTDSVMFTKLSNLSVTHADLDVALSSKADVSTVTDLQSSISNVSNEVASNSAIASSFAAVNQSVSTNSIAISANSNNQASFNNSTTANNSSTWSAIASLSNSVNSNKSYIQTVENDKNSKEYISDHQSDFNTLSAANSTTASALSSAASSSDKKAESNAFRIFQAENKINTTYQNAVNTAKSYTDNNVTPIKPYANRDDAVSAANASTVPMLAVYPNPFQVGKVVDVLGVYSYGNATLPDVKLQVNPVNGTDVSGVTATYNPNTHVISFGGSINFNGTLAANATFLSVNISQLNMNDIVTGVNYTSVKTDTDTNRTNLIYYTNTPQTSYNFAGDKVTLKYDGSLKPKWIDLNNIVSFSPLPSSVTSFSFAVNKSNLEKQTAIKFIKVMLMQTVKYAPNLNTFLTSSVDTIGNRISNNGEYSLRISNQYSTTDINPSSTITTGNQWVNDPITGNYTCFVVATALDANGKTIGATDITR